MMKCSYEEDSFSQLQIYAHLYVLTHTSLNICRYASKQTNAHATYLYTYASTHTNTQIPCYVNVSVNAFNFVAIEKDSKDLFLGA